MTDPTLAAAVVGVIALSLDYLRERRIEQRVQDQIDDHEIRLRAISRPAGVAQP